MNDFNKEKSLEIVKTIYYFSKGSFAILNNKTGRFIYAIGDAWKYIFYEDRNSRFGYTVNTVPAEYFGDIEGLE